MTDVYKDSVQIELDKATVASGVETASLTMREPTVADQLAMEAVKGSAGEREVHLFASLCDVEPNAIKRLTMRDYKKLQAAYSGFTE